MKTKKQITSAKYLFLSLIVSLSLSSCQDVIQLETTAGEAQLVVDGWVTNQPVPQQIRLTATAAYFDNAAAKPALNATVTVTDNKGKIFSFKDLKNNGLYVWNPAHNKDTLGRVGGIYTLNIVWNSQNYRAVSRLNRVPKVDSITYYFDKFPIAPPDGSPQQGYQAEFYARDPIGVGDCYWIKSFKNQKYFDKASQISIAFDGAFNPGANSDGLMFILPIRRSISNELLQEKDTIRVDLWSIPVEGYYFLNQVRTESNNAGLFATPPSNIISNIQNTNTAGPKALGFFGAASISSLQTIVDAKKAKPKP